MMLYAQTRSRRWFQVMLFGTLWISVLTGFSSMAQTPQEEHPNALSMGRMGAGIPSGWQISGENFAWEADEAAGPLGIGAARIRFTGAGSIEIDSPGQLLKPGGAYALALWIRSEPAGVHLEMEVRDNDSEQGSCLKISTEATGEWQCVTAQEPLFPSLKGGYYVRIRLAGVDCAAGLDGLWLGEKETPLEAGWRPSLLPAGVVLEPEAPWGLVTGNEPFRVRARVAGVTESGCQLELRAVHVNGGAADLPALELDHQGKWEKTFEITDAVAQPFGMMRVEGIVTGPDGRARSPQNETLLARAPEPVPGPRPDSPFGTHVLLQEPDVSTVAKLGYKWCRIHDASGITKWGFVEPEKGQWEWFDDQVALVRSHGMRIVGMLDSAPPWASGTEERGYFGIYHAPKNIADWRNYVHETVSHYAGTIDDWEVWNEPWDMFRFFQGGNPALYEVLLEAAWQEAKAAHPACTIVGVDTYPPMWDAAVLMLGAYPYYDMLSWHRYDSNLQGRPNDSIARVAQRLAEVQKPFGPPKPTMCSEGGIDVGIYHGSFFSFAAPSLAGDWSRGADLYARWYLSAIASGNKRVLTYSMHGKSRHGLSVHNMMEPGPLLRPMHLALSGLAHFIEGARYEKRLRPTPDASGLLFQQEADPGASIVVLFSDGEEPEDLPRPLPEGVACYDRWSNPIAAPTQATRSPAYLVAASELREALIEALQPNPSPAHPIPSIASPKALLEAALSAAAKGEPPLWTLFTTQGSVAVWASGDGAVVANRTQLRDNAETASRFKLPEGTAIADQKISPAGMFTAGQARITAEVNGAPASWMLSYTAVQDGPGNGYRLAQLSLVPDTSPAAETDVREVEAMLKRWEQSLLKASTRELHGLFHSGPKCLTSATLNGEYFVFTDPEHLITMMNTVVMWGAAKKSELRLDNITIFGDTAAVSGRWDIDFLAFGSGPYAVSTNLAKEEGVWRMISLCCSAGKAYAPPPEQ